MQKLLGNRDKGLVFIISSPAGGGKTTLINMLEKEFSSIKRSITYTTRAPRQGEVNGKDYFFLDKESFEADIERGNFLEYTNVFGNYYGSSKKYTEKIVNEKKHAILNIDTKGALKLQKTIKAVYIFIMPPSIEELKRRMEKRALDSEEVILNRLSFAKEEMQKATLYYDYIVMNDDLDIAYEKLKAILIAEECKVIK